MKKIIPAVFIFTILQLSAYSQTNEFRLGFTGSYPANFYPGSYDYTFAEMDWGWFGELSCNTWQGWKIDGRHTDVIDTLEQYNLYGYFQPDTLIYHAAYGRISLFEAEEDFTDRHHYTDHNLGTPTDDIWNGVTQRVQFFDANGTTYNPPIAVMTDVDERKEQVVSGIPHQYTTNTQDPFLVWYIKPRMRITTTDAFLSNREVVKIIVKSFDSTIVDSMTIYTSDFRYTNSSTYDGRYLEDFFVNNLLVNADQLRTGMQSTDVYPNAITSCKVDYEIHWYGGVDVWIDYVKVMDYTAHNLLDPNEPKFRKAIIREMNQLLNFDGLKGFYTEEVQYCNIRCLKFIQNMLKDSSSNNPKAKLTCLVNPPTFRFALSDWDNPNEATKYAALADNVDPPAFVFAAYPFEGPHYHYAESRLPNTITSFTYHTTHPQALRDEIDDYYGSIKVSPSNYNTYIQGRWDWYKNELEKYGDIAFDRDMKFYVNTGIQAFHYDNIEWNREPMMTEMNAMYGMALCYGATGILQYAFESFCEMPTTNNFNFGMMDVNTYQISNSHTVMVEKRGYNFFGEEKWNGFVGLHNKVEAWGPIVANSTWAGGYSIHSDGANHDYISDIKSIYRNPSSPYAYSSSNEDATRYWELGFFDPMLDGNFTKYFMMVNRRCVPETSPGVGDLRQLKIKFNGSELMSFENWSVVDIYTGQTVVTFPRLSTSFYDFGEFQPGEGKLYRIAPTFIKGGTLVTNEDVSGQTFTCEDTVLNGGYNITIDSGTTILTENEHKIVNIEL